MLKMRVNSAFAALFLLFFVLSGADALDKEVAAISDDSSLRLSLAKTVFIEPPMRVLSEKPSIKILPSGERVQVRAMRDSKTEFSVVLARQASDGSFPGWVQGSYIVTRSMLDGSLVRIRVFLRSDPYTYIQFTARGDGKSLMDVVLYDAFVRAGVPYPYPLSRILALPLNDVLELENGFFPRRYFEPEPDNYKSTRVLVRKIRSEIKGLEFADDGAIDENGNYVYIKDLAKQTAPYGLNCSGFAKWFVDELLYPLTGKRLEITPLKAPYGTRGSLFTSPFERLRDPYFGLDWTRNLSSYAQNAFYSVNPAKPVSMPSLEDIEVENVPFSQIKDRENGGVRYYPGHLPDAGFGIEGLKALLYTLAIDEPSSVFIGAVNDAGGDPVMRTFFHIAVFIPYFDEGGAFHIAVFESAAETPFNKFRARYPSGYINLCRLPAPVF